MKRPHVRLPHVGFPRRRKTSHRRGGVVGEEAEVSNGAKSSTSSGARGLRTRKLIGRRHHLNGASPTTLIQELERASQVSEAPTVDLVQILRQFTGRYLHAERPHEAVIGVISPSAGDGRSTMALGLAACLADVYAEVVLVETEPSRREPSIWPELDIPTRPGLGDYVEAGLNLEDVLRHTGRDNLYVLAAGASNAKSYVSLDAVSHMQKVLSQLRQRFAVVVVDLPPLLESEAAPILLECLDAAVLVIAAESTTTNDFNRTLALCGHLPIRGVLLNRERSRTPRWLQSLAIS